jgi:hypothetical protein
MTKMGFGSAIFRRQTQCNLLYYPLAKSTPPTQKFDWVMFTVEDSRLAELIFSARFHGADKNDLGFRFGGNGL